VTLQKGTKPATEATVNGLQEDDRLGGAISSRPNYISNDSQAFFDGSQPGNWQSLGEISCRLIDKMERRRRAA
jgi:hypothetical protein